MSISLEQAWQLIDSRTTCLDTAGLPLFEAVGRALRQDIHAAITQPPFPRSPLDGYALRAADITAASRENPAVLQVIDRSFAGFPAAKTVDTGEAVRIMTGAPIPDGADCVIRQEDTDCGEETVRIYTPLQPHDNYCFAGEDYRAGDLLVSAGSRITAGVCALLSGAGIDRVQVTGLPRVAVISTGSELQKPGTPLSYGKIYDANSAYLMARLRELGIEQATAACVGDDGKALESAFRTALRDYDLVISTGGVSVGQADLVPPTLKALGGEDIFHGIAVKPGMPAAFFTVDGKPVLALSGNPFACVVTFELLGRRALAALSGDAAFLPVTETAKLSGDEKKARPVRRFVSAQLKGGFVSLSPVTQNGRTRMLPEGNCLAELPEGKDPLAAGTELTVYHF